MRLIDVPAAKSRWKEWFLYPLLETLFPPQCLLCNTLDVRFPAPLCPLCAEQLEFLPTKGRKYTAACFTPSPAARALLRAHPKLRAALLFTQYHRLDWPFPDYVVPLGDRALARAFARLIKRPYRRRPPKKRHLLFVADDVQRKNVSLEPYRAAQSSLISFLGQEPRCISMSRSLHTRWLS